MLSPATVALTSNEYVPPGSRVAWVRHVATEDVGACDLVAHTETNCRPVLAVSLGTKGNR
jgi:hypothetical protein